MNASIMDASAPAQTAQQISLSEKKPFLTSSSSEKSDSSPPRLTTP